MKVVAFVPIKLDSERLPNKNLLPLDGKPLCWHILETLSNVSKIDDVYVFCSDEKILEYIPNKVKYLKRDKELDGSLVKGSEIYRSFINNIDADVYLLAHTTSPFLNRKSIQLALDKVLEGPFDSSFSAQKIQTFAWYKDTPLNYSLNDIPRTQDINPLFIETSGFYIFYKEVFSRYQRRIGFKPYIHEVDDIESIDIDTKDDYEFAKLIYSSIKN